ncbi:glycoside hydrolase [Piptocephalis cylindrospora]|uniref:alpha-1,2-Mannosidase n=1 Tax=Piptocephalis cylindrospora TaxID=1907219 RepID=A0A4P9Y384_9FUNG|nr:glycoside hydrolase [Piptocephalis cylindrospora]|eukprot:RKP13082.1 glycoside hydrolase [Piptocephalis cylindrospora]
MSLKKRRDLREKTKEMFFHGFNGYMTHAFPSDELGPISCTGVGRDKDNPFDYGRNDVMGDYLLTLVDSMDAVAIIAGKDLFAKTVQAVIKNLDLDKDNQVQVFECSIRILGGLLSAHILATDDRFGFVHDEYNGELLVLAKDLGDRLLKAFVNEKTDIPFSRVNLRSGPPKTQSVESCSAGAGTLLLEFGTLSRLTGDPRYEDAAKKAMLAIWERRSHINLVGNGINVVSGKWFNSPTGVGAGIDSFFEYLLKSAILFNDNYYLTVFDQAYRAVLQRVRDNTGYFYLNVDMITGKIWAPWIDSLSAFFPGLQVLAGDLESAIRGHLVFQNVWFKYGGLPERYNFHQQTPELSAYPLRPEHAESTYHLYQATKDPMYLEMGEKMLTDIDQRTRTQCGFASLTNIITGKLEDRQESFFLSETLKYLYLLFDIENPLNSMDGNFVFTTEAHIMALPRHLVLNSTQTPLAAHIPRGCPKYVPGKLMGIRSREDTDWVRAVVNYQPKDAEERRLLQWNAHLMCIEPKALVAKEKKRLSSLKKT